MILRVRQSHQTTPILDVKLITETAEPARVAANAFGAKGSPVSRRRFSDVQAVMRRWMRNVAPHVGEIVFVLGTLGAGGFSPLIPAPKQDQVGSRMAPNGWVNFAVVRERLRWKRCAIGSEAQRHKIRRHANGSDKTTPRARTPDRGHGAIRSPRTCSTRRMASPGIHSAAGVVLHHCDGPPERT